MTDEVVLPSGRDIWEVANQLEGYVDMTTPDDLAGFLLREGKAASELATTIATLQAAILEKDAEIADAVAAKFYSESEAAKSRGNADRYESALYEAAGAEAVAEAIRARNVPAAHERCPSCDGSGLALNAAGEPDDCGRCHGDTVVPITGESSDG